MYRLLPPVGSAIGGGRDGEGKGWGGGRRAVEEWEVERRMGNWGGVHGNLCGFFI